MNLTEHTVTKISGKPYETPFAWCLDVEADSWGSKQNVTLTFESKEAAGEITTGYKFEA